MKVIPIIIAMVLFIGCTTLKDASNARGTGIKETYGFSYNKVWDAAIAVVMESELYIVSKDKEAGIILARRGMSAWSSGENVAIFVESKDQESTRVEVVSKKVIETQIFAKYWGNVIHTELRNALI